MEKRIENLEAMVADLIRIVGHTNAMIEEMRDELRNLNGRVGSLEGRFDSLEAKVDGLREDVDIIKSTMVTKEDIQPRMDWYMEKLGRLEEDVYRLKRLVGIK